MVIVTRVSVIASKISWETIRSKRGHSGHCFNVNRTLPGKSPPRLLADASPVAMSTACLNNPWHGVRPAQLQWDALAVGLMPTSRQARPFLNIRMGECQWHDGHQWPGSRISIGERRWRVALPPAFATGSRCLLARLGGGRGGEIRSMMREIYMVGITCPSWGKIGRRGH